MVATSAERFNRSIPRIIPKKADILVQILLQAMQDQSVNYGELATRAGTTVSAMRKWRRGQRPNLGDIRACLNVMEFEIIAIRTNKENSKYNV